MKPSYQAYYGMGAATTGFNCIAVEGGSKLLIAGQELEIISAPGHTDGHLALLHRMTGTVLVGDHCVGQGSSVLDPSSGANMQVVDKADLLYSFLI
jgi:glyoxylase-like metal-dependent hydrolase (beta-lactamase superfamily II)